MMSSFVWKRQRQTHSFIWYGLLIQDKCVDYIVYVLYICVHIYQFVKNSVSGSIANNLQEQRIPPCLVKEKISGWNFAHRHYFEMPPILLLCSAISKSPPRSLTSIATIQFNAWDGQAQRKRILKRNCDLLTGWSGWSGWSGWRSRPPGFFLRWMMYWVDFCIIAREIYSTGSAARKRICIAIAGFNNYNKKKFKGRKKLILVIILAAIVTEIQHTCVSMSVKFAQLGVGLALSTDFVKLPGFQSKYFGFWYGFSALGFSF